MAVIDIGMPAVNRDGAIAGATVINMENPANLTGKITQIQIYLNTSCINVEIATFYEVSSDYYSTRDTVLLGNVGAGGPQSFDVELDVHAGDLIGMWAQSGNLEHDFTGFNGIRTKIGDQIPCTNANFPVYGADDAISLYGTGVSPDPPTVTTQAVTDIGTITATGNGNITNTGYAWENCTKRGICWNTTGSPDVNDSKSEETGSFGTGAFTRPMTGLLRGEKYYVKAYAYNESQGYGYGSEVTFYTKPSVTTYAPIDIIRTDPTVITANGLIELDTTGTIATRGFKYGLSSTDTWSESEGGTFSEGTFSLQITGLDADTTHYIRAYAASTGTWATAYGSYVAFKTAYPYGSFKTEIETEATASSGDIAAVGGKRSLTIENHLIQNQTLADLIANNYLAEYKDQKTKLVVTRPTPAPYEIGDTIIRGGALPYYAAVSALISYAPAATAEHPYSLADRDMLIRKLNVSFSAGNYVSVIELESS